MSGDKCRRLYLDHEMDGRIDRVRCEQGEERCEVCRASDTMMDELEAQRQAYVQQDHYQHDHEVDSRIQMLTMTPCRSRNRFHSDTQFPSSPPWWFNRGISTDHIHLDERDRFHSHRQTGQRFQSQSQVQYAGQEIWELEKR